MTQFQLRKKDFKRFDKKERGSFAEKRKKRTTEQKEQIRGTTLKNTYKLLHGLVWQFDKGHILCE